MTEARKLGPSEPKFPGQTLESGLDLGSKAVSKRAIETNQCHEGVAICNVTEVICFWTQLNLIRVRSRRSTAHFFQF